MTVEIGKWNFPVSDSYFQHTDKMWLFAQIWTRALEEGVPRDARWSTVRHPDASMSSTYVCARWRE